MVNLSVGQLSLPIGSVLTGQPEVIGDSVLSGAAASVSFQFQPVYRAVMVSGYIHKDGTANTAYLTFNGDTGANYSRQTIEVDGAGNNAQRVTGASNYLLYWSAIAASMEAHFEALVTKTTAAAKAQVVHIGDFDRAGPTICIELSGGEWSNTADLLSRIDIGATTGNFAAASSFTLWGWRL